MTKKFESLVREVILAGKDLIVNKNTEKQNSVLRKLGKGMPIGPHQALAGYITILDKDGCPDYTDEKGNRVYVLTDSEKACFGIKGKGDYQAVVEGVEIKIERGTPFSKSHSE